MSDPIASAYVQIRADTDGLREEIRSGVEEATAGEDPRIPVHFDVDDEEFKTGLDSDKGIAKSFGDQKYSPTFEADDDALRAALDDNVARANELSDRVYAIKMTVAGDARVELEALRAEADRLNTEVYTPHVTADGVADTKAHLDDLNARLDEFGKKRETAKVSVDTGDAEKNLSSAERAADGASDGMSGLVKAALAVGPALIPISAAATAGIGSVASLAFGAVAGLGAFGLAAQGSEKTFTASAQKILTSWQTAMAPFVKPVLTDALKLIGPALADLDPLVEAASRALGSLSTTFGQVLASPALHQFITFLAGEAGPALTGFAKVMIDVGRGVAGFVEAFAPVATVVASGIERLAGQFATFGETLSSSTGFKTFMDYAITEAPVVGAVLGQLARTFGDLVSALQPLGAAVLSALDPLLKDIGTLSGPLRLLGDAIAGLLPPAAKVVSAFVGALVPGLDALLKALTPVAEALAGGLAKSLTQVAPLIGQVVSVFVTGMRPALVALTPVIAQLAGSLGQLLEQSLTVVLQVMRQVVPPFAQLLVALIPLIPPLVQLAVALLPIATALTRLVVIPAAAFLLTLAAALTGALVPALIKAVTAVTGAVNAVARIAQSYQTLGTATSAVAAQLTSAWDAIASFFEQVWSAIRGVFTSSIGAIRSALSSAWSSITAGIQATWSAIEGFFASAWAHIEAVVSGGVGAVVSFIASLPGKAESALGSLPGALAAIATAAMAAFLTAIVDGIGAAISRVGAIPGEIVGAVGNLSGLLFEAGEQVMQGMANGIEAAAGSVASAAAHAASDAFHAATSFLGIHSPSTLFHEVGMNIGLGLAAGIVGGAGAAVSAATKMAADVVAAARPVLNPGWGGETTGSASGDGQTTWPGTTGGFGGAFYDAQAQAARLSALTGVLTASVAKSLTTASNDIAKGLQGNMAQLTSYVNDAVSTVNSKLNGTGLDKIVDALGKNFTYLSSTAADSLKSITSQLSAAQSAVASIKQEISQNASNLEGQFNVTSVTGQTFTNPNSGSTWTAPVSGANIIASLQADVASLRTYRNLLDTLKAWGLSPELLAQLVSAGPASGMAAAQALVAGGKKEVNLADVLQGQIDSTSTQIATISATATISGKTVGLSQAEGIVSSLEASKTKITTELDKLATDMKDAITKSLQISGGKSGTFKTLGDQMMAGIQQGINDSNGPLKAELEQVAKSMEAAIKAALGIKSPSTVFADVGTNIIQGLAQGIAGAQGTANDALEGVWDGLTAKSKQKALAFDGGTPLPGNIGSGLGGASITYAPSVTVQGDVGPEKFEAKVLTLLKNDRADFVGQLQREIGKF